MIIWNPDNKDELRKIITGINCEKFAMEPPQWGDRGGQSGRPGLPFGSGKVVYMCFFVETSPATTHRGDIILNAVWKKRTWVTAGSFPWEKS